MNNSVISAILVVHIAILLILGLLALMSFYKTRPSHRPMIIFIWIIVAGDLIQSFSPLQQTLGPAVVHLSHLVEVMIVAWQAKLWGMFKKKPFLLPVLLGVFLACWAVEMFTGPLMGRISWTRILFSLVIVMMAIRMLTGILVARPRFLFKNSAFLFCIGLMFYYAFLGMWESVMIVVEDPSPQMLEALFYCSVVMIILTNLINLKAILCLPSKQKF